MWVNKKQIADDIIYNELSASLTREYIIRQAERNNEYPFGFLLDIIKDNYPVTPEQLYDIAMKLLHHFGL